MTPDPEALLATAIAAARTGGDVLMRHFRSATLDVRLKGENDYVTRADRESEAAIAAVIRGRHPQDHLLGEEGGAHGGGSGARQWLIDPLDGTTNFLHGLPVFSVSIACREGAELVAAAVLDPVGDNLFTAARGRGAEWNGRPMRASGRAGLQAAFLATGFPFRAQAALPLYLEVFRELFRWTGAIRRCGSAALDLAYTAAGVYDGFFEFRLSPWDVAAGALLIVEAGGTVSDLDGGGGYLESGNVLAGGAAVWPALHAAVRRHASEARLAELVPAPAGRPSGLLC